MHKSPGDARIGVIARLDRLAEFREGGKLGQFAQDPADEIFGDVQVSGQGCRTVFAVQGMQEQIREVVTAQKRISILTGTDHFASDLRRGLARYAPDREWSDPASALP